MDVQLEVLGSSAPAFVLSFDLEQMTGAFLSSIPRFGCSAQLRQIAEWAQPPSMYPIVTELHGILNSSTAYDQFGALLLPPEALPCSFSTRERQAMLQLTFTLSDRLVQFLEEERVTKQGGRDMRLGVRFWGTVALAALQEPAPPNPLETFQGTTLATIVGFRQVRSGPNAKELRIPRSDWLDRLLPGLGYERSVLVELPLTRTPPVPAPFQHAVVSLDAARKAFEHEDYRAVLKHGRDVLEHLGKQAADGKLTTFCQEQLEPVVGKTKSQVIDRVLNGLRDVLNAGSHANVFAPDRAIAAYVIETLAIQLRYLSAVVAF